jgi:hypothetical protein
LSATSSAVSAGSCSYRPAAYRPSIKIFLPSIYPKSRRPCRKEYNQGFSSSADPPPRYPIRGRCCASEKEHITHRIMHTENTVIFVFLMCNPASPTWIIYLITRSARASTFGGIVRPICLAVLRLITNSNFVGCSTGMSAGFAPFRILST